MNVLVLTVSTEQLHALMFMHLDDTIKEDLYIEEYKRG